MVTTRALAVADAAALAGIEAVSPVLQRDAEGFRVLYANALIVGIGAEEDGVLIGYCCLTPGNEITCNVIEPARSATVGAQLVGEAILLARDLGSDHLVAYVTGDREAAVNLLVAQGFGEVGGDNVYREFKLTLD